MISFESFEEALGQALTRLYDPNYDPIPSLWGVLHVDASQGVGPLQSAVQRAVEELQPDSQTPPGSVMARAYEVLHHRFVLKLTQEEAAQCMNMSVRSLRRVQRDAIHVLARQIWDRASRGNSPLDEASRLEDLPIDSPANVQRWLAQVRKELTALRASDPNAEADIAETIGKTVRLARVLTEMQDVVLEPGELPTRALVRIHPSALKQVLLASVRILIQGISWGSVRVDAKCLGENYVVTLTAAPGAPVGVAELSLIREILAVHSGSVELQQDTESTILSLTIPSASSCPEKLKVLVIDDNEDLVRSFQLFAVGTQYKVLALDELQDLSSSIEVLSPDLIVLDVMLPHTDGWELLVELRSRDATRSMPIIVCSVVPEEDLAFALGATLVIRKPVYRRGFLDALQQAFSLHQSSSEASGSLGNSAAVG